MIQNQFYQAFMPIHVSAERATTSILRYPPLSGSQESPFTIQRICKKNWELYSHALTNAEDPDLKSCQVQKESGHLAPDLL